MAGAFNYSLTTTKKGSSFQGPTQVSTLPVTLYSGSVTNVAISNGSLPVLLFGGTTVNITVT